MKKTALGVMLIAVLLAGGCVQQNPEESPKVGVILPLTGAAANLGGWALDGVNVAKAEMAGSALPVELAVEDDQCDGKAALSAFEKITSINSAPVVVGPLCNAAALPVAALAKERRVPFIVLGVTTAAVRNSGDFTFSVLPPIDAQTEKIAEFAKKGLSIGSVSVLFVQDEYGAENYMTFKESFEGIGGTVSTADAFPKAATDFRSMLFKIAGEPSEAILVIGYSPNYSNILKQAKEVGIGKKMLAVSNIQDPQLLESIPEEMNGVYYTYPDILDKNSLASFGESPNLPMYVLSGYVALKYAVSAAKKCRNSSPCIQQELKSSLKAFPFEIIIKTVKNNEFVTYEGG